MTGYIEFSDLGAADAQRSDFAEKADNSKSLRSVIGENLEKVYDDAERKDALEDARDVQRKVEERFGVPASNVLEHFKRMDDGMRADPLGGLAKAEEFFLKYPRAPTVSPKDLMPAAARDLERKLSEMATGKDLRAEIAKSMSQAINDSEAKTRLEDAAKIVPGPLKKALERILEVSELGATNPQLAAAQWFANSGVPSKSDLDNHDHAYRAVNALLDSEFSDLEPHLDTITEMINSGRLKRSGDMRQDFLNARKMLKKGK